MANSRLIVAVTGASGFVGGHIARALLARGHEVRAFGTRPEASLSAPLPDYRSWQIERGPIEAQNVDAVVHCAALVGDWGDERAYHAVNVQGTRAVLDSFPGARMIYVSTSSVYSDSQASSVLDENSPAGDCKYSAYGRTKLLGERVALERANSVVLRPHIVYGPGDTTLLPRVIASRRAGALFVPGDGRNVLSVTNVLNLTSATISALENSNSPGVFNVADAVTATLDDLLRTLLSRAGISPNIVYVPRSLAWAAASLSESLWFSNKPPRGPRVTRYVVHQMTSSHILDITKAKIQLGYDPQLDFRSET